MLSSTKENKTRHSLSNEPRDRPAIALDASVIAYKAAKGGSNPVLTIVAAIETFTELG